MPRFIASYDITDGHSEFLDAALDEGWTFIIPFNGLLQRLPNTTLWGEFADAEAANAAFTRAHAAAIRALGRKFARTKAIISPMARPLRLRSDIKKVPEEQWTVAGEDFETCRLHQLNDEDFSER